jgi:hypothetical protein
MKRSASAEEVQLMGALRLATREKPRHSRGANGHRVVLGRFKFQ